MLKNRTVFFLLVAIFFTVSEVYGNGGKVVVLDVGMGQSVLLERYGHGILIDTGLARYAPHVLSRIKYHGVEDLDYLLLSHLHPDHAGGYGKIREAWPHSTILWNCFEPQQLHRKEEQFQKETHALLSGDSSQRCLSAGESFSWQDYVIQILWPVIDEGKSLNHNSHVLLLTTPRGLRLLLMGDVGKTVERRLMHDFRDLLSPLGLSLFVASHHGSAFGTDPDFLSIVRPEVSIVSVGKNNRSGYPSDKSLAILETYSERVLRTDRDGELCFRLDSVAVEPCSD